MSRISRIVLIVSGLVCSVLSFAPAAARAEGKPVAVISWAGYDALLADLKYVGPVAGRPNLPIEVEGLLSIFTGGQGLAGLDKAKPIGARVMLEEGAVPEALIFVPVNDLDKLLEALQAVVPSVEDAGDGFKRLQLPNGMPLTMKSVGGWAFLSNSKDSLAELPKDPAAELGNLPKKYDFAVQLNVQNVPEQYKNLAVGGIKQGFYESMKQQVDEDDVTFAARKKVGEQMLGQITETIEELDTVTLGLAIDDKTRSIYLDAGVSVVAGGKLAGQLAEVAASELKSKLAGFLDPAAVADFHFSTPVTGDDKDMMLSMIETGRTEGAKKIDEDDSIEDAAMKTALKQMLNDALDVAAATVREGHLNGGALMRGDGPFELAAGAVVADGLKLEKAVKQGLEMLKQAPNFPEGEVKFGAAERDGLKFHTAQFAVTDDEAAKFFGDEVTVALGFGEKAVFLAAGQKPVDLTAAVAAASKSSPAKLPPAEMQLKLGPIMKVAAEQDDENKEVAEAMAAALAGSKTDHINLRSEYVPNGSRMRIELEEGIIAAFGKAVQKGMQRGAR